MLPHEVAISESGLFRASPSTHSPMLLLTKNNGINSTAEKAKALNQNFLFDCLEKSFLPANDPKMTSDAVMKNPSVLPCLVKNGKFPVGQVSSQH